MPRAFIMAFTVCDLFWWLFFLVAQLKFKKKNQNQMSHLKIHDILLVLQGNFALSSNNGILKLGLCGLRYQNYSINLWWKNMCGDSIMIVHDCINGPVFTCKLDKFDQEISCIHPHSWQNVLVQHFFMWYTLPCIGIMPVSRMRR